MHAKFAVLADFARYFSTRLMFAAVIHGRTSQRRFYRSASSRAYSARRRRTTGERQNEIRFEVAEVPWLPGAIAAGGVAGPALLMLGLSQTAAATSSLLLNLEGVFTAVIAWVDRNGQCRPTCCSLGSIRD